MPQSGGDIGTIEMETDDSCPDNDIGLESTIQDELEIETTNDLLRNSFLQSVAPNEWEDTTYFDESWINFIETYQSDIHPVDIFKIPGPGRNIRTWYVHYPNNDNPAASKHGCRLCRHHFKDMCLDPKYMTEFATDIGHLASNKRANKLAILKHQESPSHKMVVQGLKRRRCARLPLILEEAQKRTSAIFQKSETIGAHNVLTNYELDLGPTMNHLKTVYQSVCQLNIPFDSYEKVVLLQQLNGVDLGPRQLSRKSATKSTAWLSSEMHKNLITKLKTSDIPVAVICDESTDKTARKYLAVHLQTLEDELLMVYDYRTIHLTDYVVSAKYLKKVMIDAFEEDGLTTVMKKNLVAIF